MRSRQTESDHIAAVRNTLTTQNELRLVVIISHYCLSFIHKFQRQRLNSTVNQVSQTYTASTYNIQTISLLAEILLQLYKLPTHK